MEKEYTCISVKSPWVQEMAKGNKLMENRTWKLPDKYIGVPILLVSSKGKSSPLEVGEILETMGVVDIIEDDNKRAQKCLKYAKNMISSISDSEYGKPMAIVRFSEPTQELSGNRWEQTVEGMWYWHFEILAVPDKNYEIPDVKGALSFYKRMLDIKWDRLWE